MKIENSQDSLRIAVIKRRIVAKLTINSLNLVFLFTASGGACAFGESSLDECSFMDSSATEMVQYQPDSSKTLLDANNIEILSWNIKKGQENKWDADLQRLSRDKDLVFLQEAKLTRSFYAALDESSFRNVARGWNSSGVLTAAAVRLVNQCAFSHTEPILRSPKATLLSEYRLKGIDQTLLTVNVHMVNFSMGTTRFKAQLNDISDIITQHSGPVILSGDFNTWRSRRLEVVRNVIKDLEMVPVSFATDNRSRAFGNPLDHIFIRGFSLISSEIEVVNSSDHNALTARLSISRPYIAKLNSQRKDLLAKVEFGRSSFREKGKFGFGGGAI